MGNTKSINESTIPIPLDDLMKRGSIDGRGDILKEHREFYLVEILRLTKDDFESYVKYTYFLLTESEDVKVLRKTLHKAMAHPEFKITFARNGEIGNCKCGHKMTYYDMIFSTDGKEPIKKRFDYTPSHMEYPKKWWKK